jgi:acetyl-CoA carboxylase biotin carboxyl carrier protein
MALSYKDVAEIIKIIDASNCEEVIIELGETKIVVRRGAFAASSPPLTPPPRLTQSTLPNEPKPSSPVSSPPVSAADEVFVFRAPMTGTFYRAPSPKDPPFVNIGSIVRKGDPLCVIEVMKLFTTIQAEINGTIMNIYADDASLVEIDQPLFRTEPS